MCDFINCFDCLSFQLFVTLELVQRRWSRALEVWWHRLFYLWKTSAQRIRPLFWVSCRWWAQFLYSFYLKPKGLFNDYNLLFMFRCIENQFSTFFFSHFRSDIHYRQPLKTRNISAKKPRNDSNKSTQNKKNLWNYEIELIKNILRYYILDVAKTHTRMILFTKNQQNKFQVILYLNF